MAEYQITLKYRSFCCILQASLTKIANFNHIFQFWPLLFVHDGCRCVAMRCYPSQRKPFKPIPMTGIHSFPCRTINGNHTRQCCASVGFISLIIPCRGNLLGSQPDQPHQLFDNSRLDRPAYLIVLVFSPDVLAHYRLVPKVKVEAITIAHPCLVVLFQQVHSPAPR